LGTWDGVSVVGRSKHCPGDSFYTIYIYIYIYIGPISRLYGQAISFKHIGVDLLALKYSKKRKLNSNKCVISVKMWVALRRAVL